MMRILFVGLLLVNSLAADSPLTAAESTDARLFPTSTVVYAELASPVELISTVLDHPLRQKIESLPAYKMAIETPGYQQFMRGRVLVEGQLNMPWRAALETLLANRVSFALDANSQGAALLIHGKDSESMKLFHEKLLEFARLGPESDNIKQGEYRGVQAYQLRGAHVGVYEDRLLITNKPELGKQVLDRLIDGGESLADNPRFQTALATRDRTAAGWGFVDVQFLRQADVAKAVFQNQIDNPVGELLVGGIQSTLQKTPFATASLTASTKQFGLMVGMPYQADWVPEQREYFFGPAGNGQGPSLPRVPETLFTLSTYRGFSEMWLRAGDLFGAELNDGFARADANLTTLFAGRDFGEDILGSFRSEVGFIATRQDFADRLPRPTIKLPSFAAVLEMKESETMTRELRRIFQSLIGFLNIVGAMNGQKQLEMDIEKLGDHAELVTSSYVPEDDDRESTDANIVYNFSPSVGFSGDRFVVASSKTLARQLTTAKQPALETIDDNTHAALNAGVLRDVLADNREQLIAQNMLEDGNTREEAEAIIDLLLQVVEYFQEASVRLGTADDQLEVEIRVQVQP